jgi:hypothetical protein
MVIEFTDVSWNEVKDSIEFIEDRMRHFTKDIDVNYDVMFKKGDLVYSFEFQHNEIEKIKIYRGE